MVKKMDKNVKILTVFLLLGCTLALSSILGREFCKYQENPNKEWDFFNEINPFPEVSAPPTTQSLVVGTNAGPFELDPHYSWDSASFDVIEQVCEGLYTFDLSDEAGGYPPVPNLASAMPIISSNSLEYTIALRQNVNFTDGTKFNASSVEYNFYRLLHFMNWSGNSWLPQNTTMWKQDLGFNRPLPATTALTQIRVIYQTSIGAPIINNITIIDEYTIKMGLREPKASWLSMLCFVGSSIMSPTYLQSLDDPGTLTVNEAMDVYLSDIFGASIIGTGPFIYDTYIADVEVGFEPNPNYWQGAPKLTNLTFAIIQDDTTRNQALLSGDIDMLGAGVLPAFLDQFEADPNIDLINGGGTLNTLWITFKYTIPKVVRQAISWCYDYSWVIDVIYDRQSVRMLSPIPAGLVHSNYNYDCPTYDLAKARNYLLTDPTYGPILSGAGITAASPDSAWINLAATTPLESYNFTWNAETSRRGDVGFRLKYNMERIGMFLDVVSVSWGEFIDRLIFDRDKLEIYVMGWRPDYNDPENFILPIWDEVINGGNYYEPDLHGPGGLFDQMLTETNFAARDAIFQEIQQKMIERDFPGMYLLTSINWNALQTYVNGWIPNPLRRAWFYPVYLGLDDLTPPDINILLPVSDQIFGIDAPTFITTFIDESPLDSTWYTIDGGLTNYTYSGLSGTVDQTAWNDAGTSLISLTFYANDTLGNVGSETVNIYKDIVAPDITIHSPVSDQIFGIDAPTFIITITDDSPLDSPWYTIDGGLTNYTFSGLTGAIIQTVWDSASQGNILITFYAEDDAGNIGTSSVTVKKSILSEPTIPGYDVFLIFGVISLVAIILIKKIKSK